MANGLMIGSLLTLGVSLLLQLVAITTPGWYITELSSQGLLYVVSCPSDSPCITKSIPETWNFNGYMNDYQKDIVRYNFANNILSAMLPLIFSSICALMILVLMCNRTYREGRKHNSTTIIIVVLLTISVVLQWELTAGFANLNRAAAVYLDNVRFPWSLFLYALATGGNSAVTVMQLIKLLRDTKDRNSQGQPLPPGAVQGGQVFSPMYYTGPGAEYQGHSETGAEEAPHHVQKGLFQHDQSNEIKTNN